MSKRGEAGKGEGVEQEGEGEEEEDEGKRYESVGEERDGEEVKERKGRCQLSLWRWR